MCIEHWFIIHFENNRQAYQNAHQALQRIETLWQNIFNQPYHKTKINHFEKLKENLATAMERANTITLEAEADETPVANRNPFFTIQNFIQFFQSL
jgi:hypothetical protein